MTKNFLINCVLDMDIVFRVFQDFRAVNPDGKVLINCGSGINRSPFIIGCLLAFYEKLDYDQIYNLLHKANEKRQESGLLYNQGFVEIIKQFAQTVKLQKRCNNYTTIMDKVVENLMKIGECVSFENKIPKHF
jgi:hypothetical protein